MGMRIYLAAAYCSIMRMAADGTQGKAMSMPAGLESEYERVSRADGVAALDRSCRIDDAGTSCGERQGYRGSWAEQRVVARLATARTTKATRITTTPPTVRRSQRSEAWFVMDCCFAGIGFVLSHNFTEATKHCSDQDHKRADRALRA